jgi:hypothetical protein
MKEVVIEKMDNLKRIIDYVFEIDISIKTRKREYVNARMVFSKILNDNGYGVTIISKYLKKDHTSIMHYVESVNSVLRFDEGLMAQYMQAKEMYLSNKSLPNSQEEEIKLTKKEKMQEIRISILNDEIDNLILEKTKLMIISKKHKRLSEIINFIDKQTPHGKEDFILRKISTMFNGIKSYG